MNPSRLVCAPRCCRAPLSKAVSVCFVVLGLLAFLPPPSRAGQWVITYSNTGKTSYDIIMPPTSLSPHSTTNPPTSNGAGVSSGSGRVDDSATASVTATLTWQPSSGQTKTSDPPPTAPVSILETATASENPGPWGGSGPAPYPAGTASDGLGDSPTVSSDGHGYISSGAHPIQKDGSSGVITLDAVSMSATCPKTTLTDTTVDWTGSGGASVNLTVQVFPESVSISGTNNPAAGDYRVLTGQQITATLQGVPAGYTVTKYTWSGQSGTCFKNYDYTLPSNQLVPLGSTDLSGPAAGSTTVAALNFYDRVKEDLTVTCTVSLKAPDGTALSVTAASPKVNVLKPTAVWKAETGNVYYSHANDAYGLYPASGTGYPGGAYWHDVVVTVPTPFSGGTCCFTQLVKPNHLYNGVPVGPNSPNNGILGLDNSFKYDSYTWTPPATGTENDSPSIQVGNGKTIGDTITANDSLQTWLMYQPTGGVWVPLQMYSYSWAVTLTWADPGVTWSVSGQNPAPPNPGPAATPSDAKDPPQWSVVQTNASKT